MQDPEYQARKALATPEDLKAYEEMGALHPTKNGGLASPTEAAVMVQLLERNGHQVTTAASAEDGIASCKRDKPDLVLMDIILPGMNGFQATRALTRDAETSHIPVIIVSTKGQETDRVWGMRQGARDYIAKPPRENELIARIDALTGR